MANQKLIKIFGVIILLISGFVVYVSLSEFYITGIYKKNNSKYPWGSTDEGYPWYYKSAEIYSQYNLITGLVFLVLFIFLFYFLLKLKSKIAFIFESILAVLILYFLFLNNNR